MPRRLTPEERQLREQIKLLSAHVRETKRAERAAAKAEALANKLPTWQIRALTQLKKLQADLERYERNLTSSDAYDRLEALGEIGPTQLALAGMARNHPSMPEVADLLGWALQYLADREKTPINAP
jgi:hypothetical protein